MATTSQHKIPIISQNLPPAETLNQVMDNLNYLSIIMDNAFASIESQVNLTRTKIGTISQRVSKVAAQTELTSKFANKATVIYSPANFPSDTNNSNNNSARDGEDATLINKTSKECEIERPKYNLSRKERMQHSNNIETISLLGKLPQFGKSHINNDNGSDMRNNVASVRGLGHLPSNIENISDCLVFNTNDNAYNIAESNKYEKNNSNESNNEEGSKVNDKKRDKKWLENQPIPPSLERKQRKKKKKCDYSNEIEYKCELIDHPNYQLISKLPGLSNTCDISYHNNNDITDINVNTIAPSNIDIDNLPNLLDYDYDFAFETNNNSKNQFNNNNNESNDQIKIDHEPGFSVAPIISHYDDETNDNGDHDRDATNNDPTKEPIDAKIDGLVSNEDSRHRNYQCDVNEQFSRPLVTDQNSYVNVVHEAAAAKDELPSNIDGNEDNIEQCDKGNEHENLAIDVSVNKNEKELLANESKEQSNSNSVNNITAIATNEKGKNEKLELNNNIAKKDKKRKKNWLELIREGIELKPVENRELAPMKEETSKPKTASQELQDKLIAWRLASGNDDDQSDNSSDDSFV